jgi:hypothetical protein
MLEYLYTVSITLQAPVLSQASGSRDLGVDTAAIRDGEFPALPGTLVKGNLREAWTKLAEWSASGPFSKSEIEKWMGVESPKGSDYEPFRSRLRFAPFWRADAAAEDRTLHRIAKDPQSGAVLRGALQVIAAPHAPGREAVYSGTIGASVVDAAEAERLGRWLRKGLEFVPALGVFKGVGYGRILRVAVAAERLPEQRRTETTGEFCAEGFGLRLKPDRPFCFAKPHTPDSNRYESENFIPGAAIKGALAHRLKETGRFSDTGEFAALYRHFNLLRITHALPAGRESVVRPLAMPLSLVASHDGELHDVALKSGPGLIDDQAPAFQPDWKPKHEEKAAERLGIASLKRVLTVRTGMDTNTGAPLTGQLFARECVDPEGHVWLTDVDLSRISKDERPAVGRQLREALAEGLFHLGKTKTQATVEFSTQRYNSFAPSQPALRDDVAVIVLQTSARLFSEPPVLSGSNGEEALNLAYRDAWSRLSGGTFRLVRYFAQQSLAGGTYLRARFGSKSKRPYNPELLTAAGSVFVLELDECHAPEEAEALLKHWLEHGLPQPDAQSGRAEEEDWAINPWLAANGYGEITVNLPLHWDLETKPPHWEAIEDEEDAR